MVKLDNLKTKLDAQACNKKIGKYLKDIRIAAGLTQQEMAAGIVSGSFYSKVERGIHGINCDDLIKMLKAHNMNIVSTIYNMYVTISYEIPYYALFNNVIAIALNQRDEATLEQVEAKLNELKDNGEKIPDSLELELAGAKTFVVESYYKKAHPEIIKKAKKIIANNMYTQRGTIFIELCIGLFDEQDSSNYVRQLLDSIDSNTAGSVFFHIITVVNNYLYFGWKKHYRKEKLISIIDQYLNKEKEYTNFSIQYQIGTQKLAIRYYRALFSNDKKLQDQYIWALKECGQYAVIKEIVEAENNKA